MHIKYTSDVLMCKQLCKYTPFRGEIQRKEIEGGREDTESCPGETRELKVSLFRVEKPGPEIQSSPSGLQFFILLPAEKLSGLFMFSPILPSFLVP